MDAHNRVIVRAGLGLTPRCFPLVGAATFRLRAVNTLREHPREARHLQWPWLVLFLCGILPFGDHVEASSAGSDGDYGERLTFAGRSPAKPPQHPGRSAALAGHAPIVSGCAFPFCSIRIGGPDSGRPAP